MTEPALSRQFRALEQRLGADDATRAARTAAFASFETLGFPDRSIETWHYTDLRQLAGKELDYLLPEPEPQRLAEASDWLDAAGIAATAPRCVFIDGRLAPSLSLLETGPGLRLERLADRPDSLTERSDSATGSAAAQPPSALAALNAAFAADGIVVRVDDETIEPVHLVFLGGGRELAPQLRIRIELAAAARAVVVQHFADLPSAGESWLNLVNDIRLEHSATLELYRLQTHGRAQIHTTLSRADLGTDAKLIAGNLETGGKLIRNELELALSGERAEADLFGIAIGDERQHIDNRWAVDHRAAATISRQNYRAIVADASRSVFNGKVTVREDAQQIDARQRNDNLLLSPRAEADTKPELEIYADQVACSHGATIGELSEDQLFYLRSRGIEETTARSLLITAFAESVLRQFGPVPVRERAAAIVEQRLAGIGINREAVK